MRDIRGTIHGYKSQAKDHIRNINNQPDMTEEEMTFPRITDMALKFAVLDLLCSKITVRELRAFIKTKNPTEAETPAGNPTIESEELSSDFTNNIINHVIRHNNYRR